MIRHQCGIVVALLFSFFLNCQAIMVYPQAVTPIPDKETAYVNLESYNATGSEDQAFTQSILLLQNAHSLISVVNIPSEVNFVIIQVHSYLYNVSMSYEQTQSKSGNVVIGTNIGLFYETLGNTSALVYVTNPNPIDVQCLIAVVAYAEQAPSPGGCNMEFDIEKSPFQRVAYDDSTILVDVQPASVPKIGPFEPSCDKYPLRHDAYRMYLPEQDFSNETYFNAIKKMLTVQSIQENSYEIPTPLFGSSMRRIYSAYPGVGSVFGMVAHFANYTSAYVPIVSYACDPLLPETCTNSNTPISNAICAIIFFFGVFVAMRGYYYFKTAMFLTGMIVGGVGGHVIGETLNQTVALDSPGILIVLLTVIVGILTSLIWLLCWVTVSSPMPSLVLSGVTLGSFFFFTFYYFVPGGIFYLEFDYYFWMLYGLFIMLTIVLFSTNPILGNILCFTVLGAYATVFALDYYNGSNLKYIIINAIRRATVPNFNIAVIQPPFQERDVLLSVFWLFVVILGLCKQYSSSWERAPFPSSAAFMKDERMPLIVGGRGYESRQRSFFNRGPRRYRYVEF